MATAISAKTTAKIPIAIIPANGIGGMAPAIELPAAPDVSAELPEPLIHSPFKLQFLNVVFYFI